ITLVDKEKGTIIDSIKHVPASQNSYRTILPGSTYVFPPSQDKINALNAHTEEILRSIDFNSGKLDHQLVQKFSGVSPVLAKEIIHRAGLANRVTVPETMLNMMKDLHDHKYQPTITR